MGITNLEQADVHARRPSLEVTPEKWITCDAARMTVASQDSWMD